MTSRVFAWRAKRLRMWLSRGPVRTITDLIEIIPTLLDMPTTSAPAPIAVVPVGSAIAGSSGVICAAGRNSVDINVHIEPFTNCREWIGDIPCLVGFVGGAIRVVPSIFLCFANIKRHAAVTDQQCKPEEDNQQTNFFHEMNFLFVKPSLIQQTG